MPEIVHACPPAGSGVMPCCGKTPFEVPRSERLTVDGEVTCGKPAQPEPSLVSAGGWVVPKGDPADPLEIADDGTPYLNRNTIAMLVPEDMLVEFGHLNPTREQVAAARAEVEPRYEHEVQAWTETKAFLAQVEATEFPSFVGEILEMHERNDWNECSECQDHGGDWPCATARLALAAGGIEVPDDLVYDEPVKHEDDGTNPFWPLPMGPMRVADAFVQLDISTTTAGGALYRQDRP